MVVEVAGNAGLSIDADVVGGVELDACRSIEGVLQAVLADFVVDSRRVACSIVDDVRACSLSLDELCGFGSCGQIDIDLIVLPDAVACRQRDADVVELLPRVIFLNVVAPRDVGREIAVVHSRLYSPPVVDVVSQAYAELDGHVVVGVRCHFRRSLGDVAC